MEESNISDIISLMNDPKTTDTVTSIMEGMDEVQKVMSKFEKLVETMDRMGLKAGIMRMAGAKMGVDVDTPLGGEKQHNTGVEPKTKVHESIFTHLNTLSEAEITKMFSGDQDAAEDNSKSTE